MCRAQEKSSGREPIDDRRMTANLVKAAKEEATGRARWVRARTASRTVLSFTSWPGRGQKQMSVAFRSRRSRPFASLAQLAGDAAAGLTLLSVIPAKVSPTR